MEFKIVFRTLNFVNKLHVNILLADNLYVHYECQDLVFLVLSMGSISSVCLSATICLYHALKPVCSPLNFNWEVQGAVMLCAVLFVSFCVLWHHLFSQKTGCAQHLAALNNSTTGNKTPAEPNH